jgi:dCMP deaminase
MMNKWHKRYIELARNISTWSKDPSRQIGAVAISDSGQVLATGYNGFPRGIEDTPERYENKETKYKLVVHAEMNCIYNATYNGVSLEGSSLYIWGLPPCSECAKGMIQVGVRNVYYSYGQQIPQKWLESLETTIELFKESGVTLDLIEHTEK